MTYSIRINDLSPTIPVIGYSETYYNKNDRIGETLITTITEFDPTLLQLLQAAVTIDINKLTLLRDDTIVSQTVKNLEVRYLSTDLDSGVLGTKCIFGPKTVEGES